MRKFFLDGISEFEARKRVVAVKDLLVTEDYADDAFPRGGLIPNSILIEIIAHLASLFMGASHDFRIKAVPILLTTVSFHGVLRPGARLTVEEHVVALEPHAALMRAAGTSQGEKVVEAEFVVGFGSEDGSWAVPVDQQLQRSYFEALLERAGDSNGRAEDAAKRYRPARE